MDRPLAEPAADLLAVIEEVAGPWLDRVTRAAAARAGVAIDADRVAAMVAEQAPRLVATVATLLATDVDEQRTNPLSVFRSAVAAPTALLAQAGAVPPGGDPFAERVFPDDPYHLGPATWSDVDQRLHEPGLRWGAWKAMTVLGRRREEGRR